MKKTFLRLQGKAVPLILSIALLLTGVLSFSYIRSLQGDARIINYTGIVRGATQRLIKKEMNHAPDDDLIKRLDGILDGLSDGSEEFGLVKLKSTDFQNYISEMKVEWEEIKAEILRYREGADNGNLYALSEDYFNLADQTVRAAEEYTEKSVKTARNILLYMNLVFVILAILSGISALYQEKRQRRLSEAEEENLRKSEQLSKRFQEILEPMNEISELMYISDVDTYELLFANNAGRETFHLDEKKGKKCYEALQGFDTPCSFCSNRRIKEGETFTWEYTNPLTKRHYLLKDRLVDWDGHSAKMEIAFDITESENEKIEMQNNLDRDKVLVECISEMYRNHDIIQATNYVLEQVGKLFQAERAYTIFFHGEYFSNTAEWCREGIEPQIENLQNIPIADYKEWFQMFYKQENLIIEDVESIKESMKAGYEILNAQGIRSVILVPLERGGELNGCIGLDNPPKNLMKNVASLFQTLRYFLMLAIIRSEDEEELSRLSYYDTLTSFFNRNRYNQDVGKLSVQSGPVGVVYLDVNGLKEVNDNLGHDAGDRLLKDCAGIMRSSFKIGSYYRIGGDEFVIICTNITEEEFEKRVCELKKGFQNGTCQAAIGTRWSPECKNIHSSIKDADGFMYADKRAFYEKRQPSGRYRHHTDTMCSQTEIKS